MERGSRFWLVGGLAASMVVLSTAVLAIAVQSGASGATTTEATTFVPVDPCRLFDLRPTSTIGDRNVPLGPGEIHVQQVTGSVGACAVPDDVNGIAMNVTITQPTAASHLRVFPADVSRLPLVSSLNWVAGQAPTPNKVDVRLSPTGRIKLHNAFGQVYVLADVVGYYTTSPLDGIRDELADRYHPISFGWSEGYMSSEVGPEWSNVGYIREEEYTGDGDRKSLGTASFTVVVPGDAETLQCGFGVAGIDWLPPAWWDPPGGSYESFMGSGWAEWQSPVGGGRGHVTIINPWGWDGPGERVWKLFCRNLDGGTATIRNLTISVQTGEWGSEGYVEGM